MDLQRELIWGKKTESFSNLSALALLSDQPLGISTIRLLPCARKTNTGSCVSSVCGGFSFFLLKHRYSWEKWLLKILWDIWHFGVVFAFCSENQEKFKYSRFNTWDVWRDRKMFYKEKLTTDNKFSLLWKFADSVSGAVIIWKWLCVSVCVCGVHTLCSVTQ